jgi:hypothetical protein
MSELSISQEAVSKKTKRSTVETMFSNTDIGSQMNSKHYTLYQPPKYLKMPRRLLLHSLHLQLSCPLKKKKEQRFVLSRLKIVDQQFFWNKFVTYIKPISILVHNNKCGP